MKAILEGGRSRFVDSTKDIADGAEFCDVLDTMAFYAEVGGKVTDVSTLFYSNSNYVFAVNDCQVFGG